MQLKQPSMVAGSNPFKIHEGAVKDPKINGYNSVRSEGDNLLFLPNFSGWLGKNFKNFRIFNLSLVLCIILVILFARVGYLQVIRGSAYFDRAENNRTKIVRLQAPRGVIYDRYHKPLLQNISKAYAYVNPQLIQNAEQAQELREYLLSIFPEEKKAIDDLSVNYKKIFQDVLIADDIQYDVMAKLLIRSSQDAAIQVGFEPRRNYLYDYGLGGILGYIGSVTSDEFKEHPKYAFNDSIGKNGVEKEYESILRGEDGQTRIEVDALGREKSEIAKVFPRKGSDVVLTIDLDMQKKLYELLEQASDNNNKLPAAGVVMNPANGEILAIASIPSYDPNIFSLKLKQDEYTKIANDPAKPLFMRAISGAYPAGSIFKMTVATAALQEGLINDRFTVNSTGGIQLGNHFFPDWKAGGHGITDIYKAISDSVNTFFYTIGGGDNAMVGLGVDTIVKYAYKFGFGQKTGIDIPGENAGFVPTKAWKEQGGDKWYQGDTYNLSIGQGSLLVTPLQVARYTSFFANGGAFVQPHTLKEFGSGDTASEFQTQNRTDASISRQTIDIVRKGMRRTITSGTAQSVQSVSVPVAGKTGTAQFNQNKLAHSWFTAFAPYDKPGLVVTILVEEGGDKGLAVGAARQFLEWHYNKQSS